jgi:hypothetical protein
MLAHSLELRTKIMLTIFGFLAATVMAFRFNVFILLPTILFGWMLMLVGGVVTASPGASIAFEMALLAIAIQAGYLAGFIFKWSLLVSRRGSWSVAPAVAAERVVAKLNRQSF